MIKIEPRPVYTNMNNDIFDAIMKLTDANGKPIKARPSYWAVFEYIQRWWNISFTNCEYKSIKCLYRSAKGISKELHIGNRTVLEAFRVFEEMGILIKLPKPFGGGWYLVVLGNYEQDVTKPTHAPNIRLRALKALEVANKEPEIEE